MPTLEIARDVEISIRVTREEQAAVLQAAELEAGGDIAAFAVNAVLKDAKKALTTDESRKHILRIGGK